MNEIATAVAISGNDHQELSNIDPLLPSDFIPQLRYATALGWAMTELLGRCIILTREQKSPPKRHDFSHPILLSPIREQRERVRAVMGRIHFLAERLGVEVCTLDRPGHNGNSASDHGKRFVDVLDAEVSTLGEGNFGHDSDESFRHMSAEIRSRINILLYYWNKKIQIVFQKKPPAIYNGYTVGRGFATIRWYIGIDAGGNDDDTPPKKGGDILEDLLGVKMGGAPDEQDPPDDLISQFSLHKLLDHLQSMSAYLPPLVPQALKHSLTIWGNAIIENPGAFHEKSSTDNKGTAGSNTLRKQLGSRGNVLFHGRDKDHIDIRALIKQAIIWHDLLTGEADPTIYLDPHIINRKYIIKLFLFSLPFLAFGLGLAFLIAFFIIHVQSFFGTTAPTSGVPKTTQSITDTITTSVVTIVTAVTTIPAIRTLWTWGSKTTTDFISKHEGAISTTGKNALNLLWQRAQQEAVNEATFVPPSSNPGDVDNGD